MAVVALAGRRIDADSDEGPRFPSSAVPAVRERLRMLLELRGGTSLVCSAACGADLLALDVAGELGLRRRVILPSPPVVFGPGSVTDRPDPGFWGALFDRVLAELAPGDLVVLAESGSADYAAANAAILDHAGRLAREAGDAEILAVIVWEGKPRDGEDLTAAFANAARSRGLDVAEVMTW